MPTTGRFFGMMPQAVRDLPFVRYAITINGAQVYDRETDTAIVRDEIPLDMARELMRMLDGYDVIYDCYRANWGWMTAALQAKAEAYATDAHYLQMIREFIPIARGILGLKDLKMITFGPRPQDFFACNAPIKGLYELGVEVEIASAHKGNALKRFAAHLGLTLANCMAFGDGMNDLTMIEAAGVGVAMANAHPRVLAAADHVTRSNDEDGVACALREFGMPA